MEVSQLINSCFVYIDCSGICFLFLNTTQDCINAYYYQNYDDHTKSFIMSKWNHFSMIDASNAQTEEQLIYVIYSAPFGSPAEKLAINKLNLLKISTATTSSQAQKNFKTIKNSEIKKTAFHKWDKLSLVEAQNAKPKDQIIKVYLSSPYGGMAQRLIQNKINQKNKRRTI